MSDEIQPSVVDTSTPAPAVADAPQVEAQPERSLDDTLAATMAEIRARRPEQGTDGKFIAKAGADTATPELKVPGSPEAATPEPALPAIEAPQSLPDDVKKAWSTLPRAIQEVWSKREGETHAKITADGERLKSLGPFEELSTSIQDRLKQVNAPAPEYFRRLADADKLLVTNGPAGLRQIAEMYGIDPRAAFGVGQPTQGQPADPHYSALFQKVGALESQLTQQQQAAETARIAEANAKIDAFKKSAPHFDKVEALMAKLYEPGLELQQLYDMATKAHPEVSKLLSAEQEAKAKAEALEKQKEETAKAAKLATLSRKPGSVGTVAKTGGSWEDSMAASWRNIKARG
jgi:hypothetical protein